jgi:hypothetical protein
LVHGAEPSPCSRVVNTMTNVHKFYSNACSSLVTVRIPEYRSSDVTSGFVVGPNEKKARLVQLASLRSLTKQLCALCASSPSLRLVEKFASWPRSQNSQPHSNAHAHAHARAPWPRVGSLVGKWEWWDQPELAEDRLLAQPYALRLWDVNSRLLRVGRRFAVCGVALECERVGG